MAACTPFPLDVAQVTVFPEHLSFRVFLRLVLSMAMTCAYSPPVFMPIRRHLKWGYTPSTPLLITPPPNLLPFLQLSEDLAQATFFCILLELLPS